MAAGRHTDSIDSFDSIDEYRTAAKSAVLTTRYIRQEARKPPIDSLCVLRQGNTLPLCRRHRGIFMWDAW